MATSGSRKGDTVNVTVVGGMGKLGSVIAKHIGRYYPVRIADIKPGGEPTSEATKDADIVLVIVNTPSLPDGSYDIANVVAACAKIDLSMWRLVIIASTVNPGDVEGAIRASLEQGGKRAHWDFGLAYVPEFVRQGSVLEDFARPEYIIAGCVAEIEYSALSEFYWNVCRTEPTFMSIQSAEIAKLGLNTAITAKLAKANEIAWLCQRTPGADARDVLGAIGRDSRIGTKYFKAGPPPGGPCFPRDNLAFVAAWRNTGLGVCWGQGVQWWEFLQLVQMAMMVRREGSCEHPRFGVAGLAFKPDVVDDTESPGRRLAELLDAETYDPHLSSSCATLEELVDKSDVIVLAMPFDGLEWLHNLDLTGKTVWDWWGMIADGQSAFRGRYRRFGKGPEC